jgi:alkylation response protein AidB-like acyl-CoA dehydrogenase
VDFDFSDDQKFLKDEARKFLDGRCGPAVVRGVLDDASRSFDKDLWTAVADQGRSNCYYGAWALSTNASELPEAAAAARISATQAFQHCSKNNIQVHGGMGFTWEFDCHLYYRRSNAVAVGLGSLSYWEDQLIERMRQKNAA